MSFSLPRVICEARGAGAASQVLYSGGAATDCQNTGGASQYRYTYTYGPDHERVKLVAQRPNDTITTLYVHPRGAGELLFEKESRASNGYSETKRYLSAYGETFAVYVKKSAGTFEWRYLHRDALGSVAAITGNTGTVQETMSYEAFGERRYVTGARQDRTSPLLGVLTDRGFTGHEHLDEINLIHMNGRIFDPALARFMTADPFIQVHSYSQAYNRYGYVWNNPLRLIDPSGFTNDDVLVQKKDGGLPEPVFAGTRIPRIDITGTRIFEFDEPWWVWRDFLNPSTRNPNSAVPVPQAGGGGGPATQPPTKKKKDLPETPKPDGCKNRFAQFFNQQYDPASAVAGQYDVDVSFLLGLSAAESGWGTSPKYRNQYNPFWFHPGRRSDKRHYVLVLCKCMECVGKSVWTTSARRWARG